MSNKLKHLAKTKNYDKIFECGFVTKEEIERFKIQDQAQKALDVIFNQKLNEKQRLNRFITALAGK